MKHTLSRHLFQQKPHLLLPSLKMDPIHIYIEFDVNPTTVSAQVIISYRVKSKYLLFKSLFIFKLIKFFYNAVLVIRVYISKSGTGELEDF